MWDPEDELSLMPPASAKVNSRSPPWALPPSRLGLPDLSVYGPPLGAGWCAPSHPGSLASERDRAGPRCPRVS